jgi:hypothetical protein
MPNDFGEVAVEITKERRAARPDMAPRLTVNVEAIWSLRLKYPTNNPLNPVTRHECNG